MLSHANIIKKLQAILIILFVLLCSNIAFVYDVEAASSSQSAWNKIQQSLTEVKQDVKSDYENVINQVLHGWNPCKKRLVDIIYGRACHTCIVIKILISTFINGCSVLEGVAQEAGTKILILCFMLWIAFYILQQLSSLKNIEPMSLMNDLLTMFFKVLCTYLVIQFGFALFINYLVVPVLQWGVDFGNVMLDSSVKDVGLNNTYKISQRQMLTDSQGFLPASLLNGIMEYVAKINATVTNHMKLGHMIMCHARHMGKIKINLVFDWGVPVMTNPWTWLCGALVWVFGFIMAFAVAFYLFDATFKLAIAVVFLPILAAFWPFGALRDKALACAKMIFNAAALFVFLSLTASMGLILVDKAIQIGDIARRSLAEDSVLQKEASDAGMSAIMAAISRGDSERVKKIFSLSTAAFLALIFSYLYAIKILRSTIDDYVNKFFEDSLTGRLQEMHHKMTGLVTAANQRAKQATVGLAKEAKAMGEAGLKKMGKSAANKFKQSSQNVDQLKDGNKPEK